MVGLDISFFLFFFLFLLFTVCFISFYHSPITIPPLTDGFAIGDMQKKIQSFYMCGSNATKFTYY